MSTLRLAVAYTTRALRRGGQRTLLAVFCIGVGVMAVVSLRLAGDMVALSLTSNVRGVLGGDISVQSTAVPLRRADLATLDTLRSQGAIDGYAALGVARASVRRPGSRIVQLQLYVVDDPANFPLVGGSDVADPRGATYASLLAPRGTVILSAFASEELGGHQGDAYDLALVGGGGGRVHVAGVLERRVSAGNPAYAYMSRATYTAVAPGAPDQVGIVDVLQPDPARAAAVAADLRRALPTATVQTVQDALDQSTTTSTYLNQFLVIVGLLALLIGGIGVANTLQVSLRRRRVEIAMLKTCGYRRRDLVTLFGLEAALLGLCGGIAGSLAGIGIAAAVRVLVERVFFIDVAFHVSIPTVVSGLLVGAVTAVIFGLLPIVRAAGVRPAAVLRDDTAGAQTLSGAGQTLGLYALLAVLFAGLSASLLGSVRLAVLVVLGGLVVLLLLAGLFWLVVRAVGAIPVVERARPPWLAASIAAVAAAALLGAWLGVIGWVLTAVALAHLTLVVMPRPVKTAAKLALRSLGRSRGRTATTLVALFCGVGAIGLILVMGQDISGKIDQTLTSLSGFDVFAVASPADAPKVLDATAHLPGLQDRRVTSDITVRPVAFDGRPIPTGAAAGTGEDQQNRTGGQFRLASLNGVEGYDLGAGELPDVGTLTRGRLLTAADAGGTAVLVRDDLTRGPFRLHPGSTITLRQPTSGASVVVRVAGTYSPARLGSGGLRLRITLQPVIADASLVRTLAGTASNPDLETAVAMQLVPAQRADALRRLEDAVPRVYILDIADFGEIAQEFIGNLVVLLVAIASLSVLAGLVIIANTVALAMLERRREIGILKAVGHGSRAVLGQVVLENGLVGVIGGIAGMVAVTVAARLLQDLVLGIDLPVSWLIVVGCVAGLAALVVVTAALVAWGPTRTRPVEVLRYE